MRVLVTGGSGYFGRLLVPSLIARGIECDSVDLVSDEQEQDSFRSVRGDICDYEVLVALAKGRPYDAIFHLASLIDFAVVSQRQLFDNNVTSTRNVARLAVEFEIPKVVFTSSNSIYLGNDKSQDIRESDMPIPTDDYGKSKVLSEEILAQHSNYFDTISIRCPIIMDAGRIGMLSILFEFIREGRKCWVIGDGTIRHQFIYAGDLIEACSKALEYGGSGVFNIGSDNVPTIDETYQYIIDRAATGSRIAHVPAVVAMPLLRLAHRLGLSPLGEYQFRMLTSNFVFDTSEIKRVLDWRPSLTNGETLYKAYEYYIEHRDEIRGDDSRSANRSAVSMGLIDLLRRIS